MCDHDVSVDWVLGTTDDLYAAEQPPSAFRQDAWLCRA